MRINDRLWKRRNDELMAWAWERVYPPRNWRRRVGMRAVCMAMYAHRWLWVRGVWL